SPDTVLANGTESSVITAIVHDAGGNLVGSGAMVNWTGDITDTSVTDANSRATLNVPASTAPQVVTVTATASMDDPGKAASVTFGVDKSTSLVSTLTLNPDSILANGKETSTATAVVTDAWGNPVGEGVTVTWSGDVSGSSQTDADSKATMTIAARTVPGVID